MTTAWAQTVTTVWAQTVTTAWAQTVQRELRLYSVSSDCTVWAQTVTVRSELRCYGTNMKNYGRYGTKYHILPTDHIYLVTEWNFYSLTKYCTISKSVYVLHRVSMYYVTVVPKIDVGNQESELTMEEMILCRSHHKTRDGKNQTNCT